MENPNLLRVNYPKTDKHGNAWKYITVLVIGILLGIIMVFPAKAETQIIRITSETDTQLVNESIVNINPYVDILQNLTPEEEDLICRILWAEANNQDMEGQRAVIEVILNRVLSPNFPNTIEGVLSQKGQFATWKSRNKVKYTHVQLDALQIVSESMTVLPSTKYVYFDRKGRNGRNKIKIQSHWFGAEK